MLKQITSNKERLINLIILSFVGAGYTLINFLLQYNAPYPSVNMSWENHIPFVSWMIFPYLSYFTMALFVFTLHHTREKLAIYMFQLLFVAFITYSIFILLPYQNAFTRPEETYTGIKHLLFTLLNQDLPYNQLPSFHISYSLLYALIVINYTQYTWLKILSGFWFIVICLSVLVLFQHHFLDIFTAILLVVSTILLSHNKWVENKVYKTYVLIWSFGKKKG